MKHYYIKRGDFANCYALRYAEDGDTIPAGFDRITRKDAEQLARREKQRRKDDPNFSGYADAEIKPFSEID